ncbi:hypothetical protein J2X76_003645 [Neorhizobium sp. 2083]|uniref:hypothetical protein n=1 Tax=Neorhizobium sp. 2083 TaxID=2817762 RepID=UPI00285744D9|nr:hypothetical protein [Neorhizobium sp. 2083]MDR6818468.1 hypothetical protein [Neorhizobium sp. 2083]
MTPSIPKAEMPADIDQIASDIVLADYSKAPEPDYALYLAIAQAILAERQRDRPERLGVIGWNHDIACAPRGKEVTVTRTVKGEPVEYKEHHIAPVWLATADGNVHRSYWIPATKSSAGRWSGFNPTSPEPIAWQHFVVPEHPGNSVIVHRHTEINLPIIEDVGSGA